MNCWGENIEPRILGIPTIFCHFQLNTLHSKDSNPYTHSNRDLQKNWRHVNSVFTEDIQFHTLANSPTTSHLSTLLECIVREMQFQVIVRAARIVQS